MARRGLAVKVVSSGLGLGYLPVAPGTWASAGAAAGYYALRRCLPMPDFLLVAEALFWCTVAIGAFVCPYAIRVYGKADPRRFVLDEVAGQWLTCLAFWWRGPLTNVVAAFVAFRFFDIVKPFPIRRLEKLPGAWGVMLDDLGAALYAAAALWVVCHGILDRFIS